MPTGEVGELWIKGPNVVKGYWAKPEATAESFTDGWLHTGDVARLDDEGFVYIVDRAKDMIIRGGENVYCVEVEAALFEHPAVTDAAVIGIPDHVLGEEVGAVVHLAPGFQAGEDELQSWVAGAAGRVQGAGADLVPARPAAPQRQRQDHEAGAEDRPARLSRAVATPSGGPPQAPRPPTEVADASVHCQLRFPELAVHACRHAAVAARRWPPTTAKMAACSA